MSVKDAFASCGQHQTGGAKFSGRRKLPRSRGASLNDVPKKKKKQQRPGANEDMDEEMADLNPSSLRNERSGRKSRPQIERRNTFCTRAKADYQKKGSTVRGKSHCYLRNVHDKMTDGETAFEKRYSKIFHGP